ncbi:helix-turn-helix transcriptional regulator [Kitasatospora cinereorecta]|uniref:Helix-turn-helix transcriptional regulator n=1 Tax=Kitasatospora cinereorecta TaxID=285560 RepID=A0ABW0VD72_9ACTN
MPRRIPTDMARTVHPALAGAALHTLAALGTTTDLTTLAADLLATGEPVPEQLHARLLDALAAHGWPALLAAAEHLLSTDPLRADLAACATLTDLLDHAAALEGWFHVGHETQHSLTADRLTVHHVPALGRTPTPAESLFVCAVHVTAATTVTGRNPHVLVTVDGVPGSSPDRALRTCTTRIDGWHLAWERRRPRPRPTPLELRALLARTPAHRWHLAEAARDLGVAPRTLQRGLAEHGTTFQQELLTVRLDAAGQLISRTALPLAEIAAAAGFTDHAHLTNRFRTRFGRTPSTFRSRP